MMGIRSQNPANIPTPALVERVPTSEIDLRLKVLNLNIEGWSSRRKYDDHVLRFLDRFDWDLLTIQEASKKTCGRIAATADYSSEVLHGTYNAAVFARNGFRIAKSYSMTPYVLPERAIAAEVVAPSGTKILACAWHAQHGCEGKHFLKAAQYMALSDFLGGRSAPDDLPILLGCDANGGHGYELKPCKTERDRWQYAQHHFWSSDAKHGLRNAMHVYFEKHPEDLKKAKTDRPNGPMAISYDTSQVLFRKVVMGVENETRSSNFVMFDHILVSKHFEVSTCEYDLERSVTEAYTDHSAVFGELTLSNQGSAANESAKDDSMALADKPSAVTSMNGAKSPEPIPLFTRPMDTLSMETLAPISPTFLEEEDSMTKATIEERIAERKRLGMSAEEYNLHTGRIIREPEEPRTFSCKPLKQRAGSAEGRDRHSAVNRAIWSGVFRELERLGFEHRTSATGLAYVFLKNGWDHSKFRLKLYIYRPDHIGVHVAAWEPHGHQRMDRLLAFRQDIEAASPYPLVEPHFWPIDSDRADRAGWWIATDRVSDLDNEKLWPDYHKHVAERIVALHDATDRFVRLVLSGDDQVVAAP